MTGVEISARSFPLAEVGFSQDGGLSQSLVSTTYTSMNQRFDSMAPQQVAYC